MIDPQFGQNKLPPHQCGPCHRISGLSGIPSMAIPNRPDIDLSGGFTGLCEGHHGKEHGMVTLTHLGEPISDEIRKRSATEAAKAILNLGDVKAGHSLTSV